MKSGVEARRAMLSTTWEIISLWLLSGHRFSHNNIWPFHVNELVARARRGTLRPRDCAQNCA